MSQPTRTTLSVKERAMLEIFFTCGIALAVYLIFCNIEILAAYSDYVFWIFIGCIILLAVVGVICAIIAIKNLVTKQKGN